MKYWSVLILLFLAGFEVCGQTLIRVLDKTTSEPIPYAVVCIQSSDEKEKSADVTNEKGEIHKIIKSKP